MLVSSPIDHPLSFELVVELGRKTISISKLSFSSSQILWICEFPKCVLDIIFSPNDLLELFSTLFNEHAHIYVPKYPCTLIDDALFNCDNEYIQQFLLKIFDYLKALDFSNLSGPDKMDLVKFCDYFILQSLEKPILAHTAISPYLVLSLYLKCTKYSVPFLQHTLYELLGSIFLKDDEYEQGNNLILLRETILILFNEYIQNSHSLDSVIGHSDLTIAIKTLNSISKNQSAQLSLLVFILDELVLHISSKILLLNRILIKENSGVSLDSFSYLHELFQICHHSIEPVNNDEHESATLISFVFSLSLVCSFAVDLMLSLDIDLSEYILTLFKLDLVLFYCQDLTNEYRQLVFNIDVDVSWNQFEQSLKGLSSKFEGQGHLVDAFLNSAQIEKLEVSNLWLLLILRRYLGSSYFTPLICSIVDFSVDPNIKRFVFLLALGPRKVDNLSIMSCLDGRDSTPILLPLWLFSMRRECNPLFLNIGRTEAISLIKFCQEQACCDFVIEATSQRTLKNIELISLFHKCIFIIRNDPVALLITHGFTSLKSDILSFYFSLFQNIEHPYSCSFLPIFIDYINLYLVLDAEYIDIACKLFSYIVNTFMSLAIDTFEFGLLTVCSISSLFVSLVDKLLLLKSSSCFLILDEYFSSTIWTKLVHFCLDEDFLKTIGKKKSLDIFFRILSLVKNDFIPKEGSVSSSKHPYQNLSFSFRKEDNIFSLQNPSFEYFTITSFCIKEVLFHSFLSPAMLDSLNLSSNFFRNIIAIFHILFDGTRPEDISNLMNIYNCTLFDLGSFYFLPEISTENHLHNEKSTRLLFLYSLYSLFSCHPLKVRHWWLTLSSDTQSMDVLLGDKNGTNIMSSFEEFISLRFSPLLVKKELDILKDPFLVKKLLPMELSLFHSTSSSSIVAKLPLGEENAYLEINLSFPEAYPLNPLSVQQSGKRIGVSETVWRRWLLSTQVILSAGGEITQQSSPSTRIPYASSSTILEAFLLWKKNAEYRFSGIEECIICYSIFQPFDFSVPSKPCSTCKHKFHSSCLVQLTHFIFRLNGLKLKEIPHALFVVLIFNIGDTLILYCVVLYSTALTMDL